MCTSFFSFSYYAIFISYRKAEKTNKNLRKWWCDSGWLLKTDALLYSTNYWFENAENEQCQSEIKRMHLETYHKYLHFIGRMKVEGRASESERQRESWKAENFEFTTRECCASFVHGVQSSIARTNLHRSPWFEWVSSVTQTMCWCVKLRQEITFETCYHRIAYVAVHKQMSFLPSKTHSTIAICISSEKEDENSFCVFFSFSSFLVFMSRSRYSIFPSLFSNVTIAVNYLWKSTFLWFNDAKYISFDILLYMVYPSTQSVFSSDQMFHFFFSLPMYRNKSVHTKSFIPSRGKVNGFKHILFLYLFFSLFFFFFSKLLPHSI